MVVVREATLRLGRVTVRMPLWTASVDLTVADFFLGTAGGFYTLLANGLLSMCA